MFGNLFIDVLTLLGVFILFGLIIVVLGFIIMIVQSFIKTFTRNKSSELRKNKNVINRYSAAICNIFEDLLEENNITIPDTDRIGEKDEARLFGENYFKVENLVSELLLKMTNELNSN